MSRTIEPPPIAAARDEMVLTAVEQLARPPAYTVKAGQIHRLLEDRLPSPSYRIVRRALQRLNAAGKVAFRTGRQSGWFATPAAVHGPDVPGGRKRGVRVASRASGYSVKCSVATIRVPRSAAPDWIVEDEGEPATRNVGIMAVDPATIGDPSAIAIGPVFDEGGEFRLHGFAMSIDDAECLALRLLRTVIDLRREATTVSTEGL